MRLPVIKSIVEFVEKNDADYVHESVALLEHLADAKGLHEAELETIGELISNMLGAIEVTTMIRDGKPKSEALNEFMRRVLGSIDK